MKMFNVGVEVKCAIDRSKAVVTSFGHLFKKKFAVLGVLLYV